MSGFDNEVLYADNVDFSGGAQVTGQFTTDGQILIGSTVAPNIRVGSLTSSGGSITLTAGSGTLNLAVTSSAIAGQILRSGGNGVDPTYSTATYPSISGGSGKVLISNGTNFVSSTATFPDASATSGKFIRSDGTNWIASTPTLPTSAGAAGKILVSDATNYIESTPTFPNASATSGKIIKSDGTNWVASTETYAAPSTSGNVMTSDGTNWTSAAASGGGFLTATKNLTNAQIKAIHGTPIEIIAAPGAGKCIVLISAIAKLVYGGTNVFTAAASQVINLYYNNGTTVAFSSGAPLISNGMIVSSANKFSVGGGIGIASTINQAAGIFDNVNMSIYNPIATEITGNAANDNTINIAVTYWIGTF